MLTATGLKDPVVRRLKRSGGMLRDLPPELKLRLVSRALAAMEQGCRTFVATPFSRSTGRRQIQASTEKATEAFSGDLVTTSSRGSPKALNGRAYRLGAGRAGP
jgi:hypothetical protein